VLTIPEERFDKAIVSFLDPMRSMPSLARRTSARRDRALIALA
jgi:hypothetical protein